jgi:hypothetical protein
VDHSPEAGIRACSIPITLKKKLGVATFLHSDPEEIGLVTFPPE